MLEDITPVIVTFNEEANIGRTLAKLSWAREIVIVDSGSTDGTIDVLTRYANVRVFERPFTNHAEQWNYALHQTDIRTRWVLAMDADFVLSDSFVEELASIVPPPEVSAYRASFVYCIEGKPLRGSLYPPITVLYRWAGATYRQDGHGQQVVIEGRVVSLTSSIYHDDRKPLSRWLASQAQYMRLECEKLAATPFRALGFVNKLRRLIVIAAPAVFLYCLIVKRGLLDGRVGIYYALQRATAEAILALFLLQRAIRGDARRH